MSFFSVIEITAQLYWHNNIHINITFHILIWSSANKHVIASCLYFSKWKCSSCIYLYQNCKAGFISDQNPCWIATAVPGQSNWCCCADGSHELTTGTYEQSGLPSISQRAGDFQGLHCTHNWCQIPWHRGGFPPVSSRQPFQWATCCSKFLWLRATPSAHCSIPFWQCCRSGCVTYGLSHTSYFATKHIKKPPT